MTCARTFGVTLLFACHCLAQDTQLRELIAQKYVATIDSLRNAKTKSDLNRLVNQMDVPEWVSILPAGETITRSEALTTLEGLLSIPPEKRPMPRQQILYITETGWSVLVLYWVYIESGHRLVGSLARDTWVQTANGWKRIRHEKLFPDRPLVENGKSLLIEAPGR